METIIMKGRGSDSYDYRKPECHSVPHQYVSSSKYHFAKAKRLKYLAEDDPSITCSSSSEGAQAGHAVARPGS